MEVVEVCDRGDWPDVWPLPNNSNRPEYDIEKWESNCPSGKKGVYHVGVTGTALGRVSGEGGPCHSLGLSQV